MAAGSAGRWLSLLWSPPAILKVVRLSRPVAEVVEALEGWGVCKGAAGFLLLVGSCKALEPADSALEMVCRTFRVPIIPAVGRSVTDGVSTNTGIFPLGFIMLERERER